MDMKGLRLIAFMSIISVQVLYGRRLEKRQLDLPGPLQCYECRNARSMAECNKAGLTTCAGSQNACQIEIRVHTARRGRDIRINKGCKQDVACENNHAQNAEGAWPATQCSNSTTLSVCRYCCSEPGCNADIPVQSECHSDAARGRGDDGKFRCICNPGFVGDGYSCEDIDECTAEDEESCTGYQEICVNTIGSYSCDCEDGYTRSDLTGECAASNDMFDEET